MSVNATVQSTSLYCPFPSAINHFAQKLKTYSLNWVRDLALVTEPKQQQKFLQADFALLSARCYPTANWEQLKLLTAWNIWLFFLDDLVDEQQLGRQPDALAAFIQQLIEILRGTTAPNPLNPIETSLSCFYSEASRQFPNLVWHKRFIDSLEKSLAAALWEANNRQKYVIPTVEDYMHKRVDTSGITSILELINMVGLIEVPPAILDSADVLKISLTANNIICWANDIASYRKEHLCGDFHNLVLVIQHQRSCSFEKACLDATEIHNESMHRLLSLEQQLPQYSSILETKIQKYLTVLHHWIRGNFDWQSSSGRYLVGCQASFD